MKRFFIALMCIAAMTTVTFAKEKKQKKEKEVVYNEQGEVIKTGMNFGPLPAVAYDADKGFQLGAILQLYQYGDGSTYPNYFNRWYMEASYFTKGSMLFQLQHDNKNLIPGVRWSTALAYNVDKAYDFYGFNGYQAYYDYDRMALTNDKKAIKKGTAVGDPNLYRYNPYYRFNKTTFYGKSDFVGKITDNLYWEAGYHMRWYNLDGIDRASINKGKADYDLFPDSQMTLFELYQKWGIISYDEVYNKKGKASRFDSSVRLGLMYDTRDNEGAPTRGIWAEGHVILAPKWLGSSNSYYKYALTFRQYFPIIENSILTFAYRASYEGTFGKDAPYYALPYNTVVGNDGDKDGFGSYRTTRGVMRTRVVGLDQMLWTAELRYKFVDFVLFNQNIAFSLTAFTDGSMVTRKKDLSFKGDASDPNYAVYKSLYDAYMNGTSAVLPTDASFAQQRAEERQKHIGKDGLLKEIPHATAGLGLRFIMNTNFIVAFEYGMPFSRFYKQTSPYYKQDGNGAFYINLGYLF